MNCVKYEKRKTRNIELLRNKKVMMITFDDGPDENITPQLLDELTKRDIKVTFFTVGSKMTKFPDIVRRAYSEGHAIANHTYNHRDLTKLCDTEVLTEITTTNKILYEILGINNKYLRCPFGNIDERIIRLTDMTFIFWNIDVDDWKKNTSAKNIYNKIISRANDLSIVLIHDLYTHSVEGVLEAIDELLYQGYALISLEEAKNLGFIDNKDREYAMLKQYCKEDINERSII